MIHTFESVILTLVHLLLTQYTWVKINPFQGSNSTAPPHWSGKWPLPARPGFVLKATAHLLQVSLVSSDASAT